MPLDDDCEEIRQRLLGAIERRLLELGVSVAQQEQAQRNFFYEGLYGVPPPVDLPECWSSKE